MLQCPVQNPCWTTPHVCVCVCVPHSLSLSPRAFQHQCNACPLCSLYGVSDGETTRLLFFPFLPRGMNRRQKVHVASPSSVACYSHGASGMAICLAARKRRRECRSSVNKDANRSRTLERLSVRPRPSTQITRNNRE